MAYKKKSKKKIARQIEKGKIYIQSTFNNTIISLSDNSGNILGWATAGSAGFKGARKSTPFAAQTTMKNVLEKAQAQGIREVEILISGVGAGRDSAVRAIQGSNINVSSLKDVTPLPHNGCRPKKPRRV